MITQKNDVLAALDKLALPQFVKAIAEDNVPIELSPFCLSPFRRIYPAFFEHPDGFPHPDQLLILWEDGGYSLIGYLTSDKVFIQWYFEDSADTFDVIASNYQQLAFFVMRQYFDAFSDEVKAKAIANIIEFAHWDGMMQIYAKATDFTPEELTKMLDQFAASIS